MRSALIAVVIIAVLSERALAAIPVRLSDLGLALEPIIVVARWSGDPVTEPKHNVRRTSIIVERVIEGDVRPGEYPLLITGVDYWDKEGKPGTWWGPAAVDNVKQSNLWFLSRDKSWDPTSKTGLLALDAGRGIQRLKLEPFYAALRMSDRDTRVVEFLESNDQLIVTRALLYIHLDCDGWPYGPELEPRRISENSPRRPLTQHTEAVWQLFGRSQSELRRKALAVYASLAGNGALTRLRSLLRDSDAEVRHIAVGYLARLRDTDNAPKFAGALRGFHEYFACEIVDALAAWDDPRIVPALITLLEPDRTMASNEWFRVSTRTRDVLKRITTVTFPISVEKSMSAWKSAEGNKTATGRARVLRSILGDLSNPLVVTASKSGTPGRVVIRNRGPRPITVTRLPGFVEIDCGQHWGGFAVHTGRRPEFVDLSPGQRLAVTIDMPNDFKPLWSEFLSSRSTEHSLKLTWEDNGSTQGKRAWIGVVRATTPPATHSKPAGAARS